MDKFSGWLCKDKLHDSTETSVLSKMEVKAANKQVSNVLRAVCIEKGFFVMLMVYESLGFPLFCSQLSTLLTFGL